MVSIITETPSKVAAAALANLDFSGKAIDESASSSSSLLSKMQAVDDIKALKETIKSNDTTAVVKASSTPERKIMMQDGKELKHASKTLERRFVGDLSIKDDSEEPLLQVSESRFVLFPIKYHEVG